MFGKFFKKRAKKQKYSIQRLENQPFEFTGKKLSGDTFKYEDGDGEANLYQWRALYRSVWNLTSEYWGIVQKPNNHISLSKPSAFGVRGL